MPLKTYRPTILGFASKVLDKLGMNFIPAGEDTWYSTERTEDRLTDLGGEPNDDRVTAKEYLSSPFERWKASMLNKTNPLVGISRTVIPAAEGALAVTGIQSIPQAVNLIKIARSTPHGFQNLAINAATLAGVGTAGATTGNYVDKQLGGDGSIGQFAFGLGSLYGFNKIPFMRDYNNALNRTTVSNVEMDHYIMRRGGNRYKYVEDTPGNGDLYENGDDLTFVSSPSSHSLLLHWKGDPAIEMHLGGVKEPLTTADLKWQMNNLKDAPNGVYITPYSPATSRSQRISLNGITSELFSAKGKSQAINRPPTVDGYKTAVNLGLHKGYQTDWSDNYYLNGFHNYSSPKDVLFRKLYEAFILNPDATNLTNLNNYIVKIGGKPAKYINGELQIPFPIIYKQ